MGRPAKPEQTQPKVILTAHTKKLWTAARRMSIARRVELSALVESALTKYLRDRRGKVSGVAK